MAKAPIISTAPASRQSASEQAGDAPAQDKDGGLESHWAAEDARQAAADRAAAEELVAQAQAERRLADDKLGAASELAAQAAADREFVDAARKRSVETLVANPASASVEPVPPRRLDQQSATERVVVRASGVDLSPGYDPNAPLFPATARMLPGDIKVPAVPAEQAGGETRTVRVLSRMLHDGVLFEPGSTAQVTRAQFVALSNASAIDGGWGD